MHPLLKQACAGDESAQRRLVDKYSRELRAHVLRQMGGRVRRHISASDILQEIFARVFRSFRNAAGDETLAEFRRRLYRNAKWVLSDKGHEAREFAGESSGGVGSPQEAPDPATIRDAGGAQREADLQGMEALIERLDTKYSTVIRLRMQGMRFREIADQVHEKEATVRQRFLRAMRELKRALGTSSETTDDLA